MNHELKDYYGPKDSEKRDIDNSPAWMQHQNVTTSQKEGHHSSSNSSSPLNDFTSDEPATKRKRAFVCRAKVFKAAPVTTRPMPLDCDSNLPAVVMRLGKCDKSEVPVAFNIDTCAGMNTGNLDIHKYVITNFPECVHSYEEYNDENPFTPISLEGVTTDTESVENFETGKLTALVRYYTRYINEKEDHELLCFGLGRGIAVNGLIGLPTLRAWKMVIDLDENRVYSKSMRLQWKMEFIDAARGLPSDVTFDPAQFVRPSAPTKEGSALATILKVPTLPPAPSGPIPPVPSS
jgi:hypothetical protein